MWRPAGQEHQLDGCGQATLGRAVATRVYTGGFGQDGSPGKAAEPSGQRIGFARSAKVGQKRGEASLLHRLHPAVRHRQGEPGPLHQGPEIADFAHRQHAGGEAAGHGRFGFGKTGAQFLQAAATGQDNQAQPVRSQGTAALDKLGIKLPK